MWLLRHVFVPVVALAAVAPTLPSPSHLNVDLVSEYRAIAPARIAWIGLRFEIEPGWHIYWKDPGDSGEPPSVQWNLPPGLKAGAIRWPAPQRIPDHTLVDYGYNHSVLLMAPIRLLRPVPTVSPVKVSATVKYLVCREVCIPGASHVAMSLPVSRTSSRPSEWHKLFVQTRAHWPKPTPTGWRVGALATGGGFVLSLHTGSSEHQALFFPADPNVIKNAAPQPATALADGVRLTLQKSDLLVKPVTHLEGVIVFGGTCAFVIRAPVHSQTRRGG